MNNLHVPKDLLAELQAKAQAEGKTVEGARRGSSAPKSSRTLLAGLLAYGLETGRASRYTEADVPVIVKNRRRINAAKSR